MEYFVGCFPSILGDISHDNLNEQFLQYQFMSTNDLPENLKEACHYTDDDHPCRIDALWSYLRSVNKPGTKVPQFDLLFQVVETILTILHSNASEERIFSYISKCKTPSSSLFHSHSQHHSIYSFGLCRGKGPLNNFSFGLVFIIYLIKFLFALIRSQV